MLILLRMRNENNSSSEAALTQEADRSLAKCQKVINMPCAEGENQMPSELCKRDYEIQAPAKYNTGLRELGIEQ